ncbi:MAG: M15 family metallopeptidase [Gemmatimonadaceae bacterium]
MHRVLRNSVPWWLLAVAAACAPANREPAAAADPLAARLVLEFRRQPDTIPTRWRDLIGEYGPDTTLRWFALERDGRMHILDQRGNYVPLAERHDSAAAAVFDAPIAMAGVAGEVRFQKDPTGRPFGIMLGDMVMQRRNVEPPPGASQLRITPVRPIEELRREALAATPPAETGSFHLPELVELVTLDSTLRLDVRYAGDNNFLGTALYEQPRAFLQRPAAEAVARANQLLRPLGYSLLVHDAYRPWYVTKIFWDAVPADIKWLVADPAQGSKHNRGAAVDLTLYDLEANAPAEMPGTYDEASGRSGAFYPGGTSLQRYHRALLRRVMEHAGFSVNPLEWWHFDYRDWRSYPIMNQPFDRLGNL